MNEIYLMISYIYVKTTMFQHGFPNLANINTETNIDIVNDIILFF